jgi:hypothetical protein
VGVSRPRNPVEVFDDEIYIPVPINISGLGIPGIHALRQSDIVLNDVSDLSEGKVRSKKQGSQTYREESGITWAGER